jgi:hypothetical protein
VRTIAHLADPDDAIAFAAFHAFTVPAMRGAARGPLFRGRHSRLGCRAPVGGGWCGECEAVLDDLLLDSFTRLRAALAGEPPRTRTGEAVRELAMVREHVASAPAAAEDAAALAAALTAERAGEPDWLRAARAQLVHYPLRHLEGRVRRADAVARGAAARPDRDLRQAAWAAPLRADPVTLDLLLVAVFRARRGAGDLPDVPADVCERHGLDPAEGARRMGRALADLQRVHPGFFAANIAAREIGGAAPAVHDTDPGKQVEEDAAREHARAVLLRLVTRDAHRAVVAQVCAAGNGRPGDPVGQARDRLGLGPDEADRLVRRIAALVAAAGLEWTALLVTPSR